MLAVLAAPSPLSPGPGRLGLDHLNSFVRHAWQCGQETRPAELLAGLSLVGHAVSAPPALAERLSWLVVAELQRLASPEVTHADALSEGLLRQSGLDVDALLQTPEAALLDPATRAALQVVPSGGRPMSARYAVWPLVDGEPLHTALPGLWRALQDALGVAA